jgi:hypothetical protein
MIWGAMIAQESGVWAKSLGTVAGKCEHFHTFHTFAPIFFCRFFIFRSFRLWSPEGNFVYSRIQSDRLLTAGNDFNEQRAHTSMRPPKTVGDAAPSSRLLLLPPPPKPDATVAGGSSSSSSSWMPSSVETCCDQVGVSSAAQHSAAQRGGGTQ